MAGDPGFVQVASTMVRYGGLTFGGGAPTVMALEQDIVARNGWLDTSRFRLAYALSRLTPGTNLLAFCTALGWQMRGTWGGIVALIGASLPCSAVTVGLTVLLEAWQGNRWAMVAIEGASAAATGIIAAGCWSLVRPHVSMRASFRTAVLVAGAMFLQTLDLSPLRILLMAGALGALWKEPA